MPITFVTALLDFNEDRSTEKSIDRYISLFESLQSSNLRFHVFVSPQHAGKIHIKNGIIEPLELSTLDTYKDSPDGLPDYRNVAKDTRNYLILMNAKVELVTRAILSEKHASEYYAWIDFGIAHIFRDTSTTLVKLATMHDLLSPNRVYIPGCLERSMLSFDAVDWRFCGGFFVGDKASIFNFYSFYQRYYARLPKLTWEINVWSQFENLGWSPIWYKADHNDSMFDLAQTSEFDNTNETIGVAIPCYKYHIPKLTRCLDSIEAQTVKPNKVVVVCSSSEQYDIPNYNYSFPLDIVVRPDRRNAAQNRNQAASLLDTDLISFFDGDDIMHPQRIEFVKKNTRDILLHGHISEGSFQPYDTVSTLQNKLRRCYSGCAMIPGNVNAKIHHAHSTVRHSIWKRIMYHEEAEFERKEDAVFCGDVLAIPNIQSTYIAEPLSFYIMEGMTIE